MGNGDVAGLYQKKYQYGNFFNLRNSVNIPLCAGVYELNLQ